MNESCFILFDTEYTAWEGSQARNWSYSWEHRELIYISALKVKNENNTLIILDRFDYYIKPNINKILSDYIINLTGITQQLIDSASSILEVLEKFYDFSENLNLYSYGNDYYEIKENIILNKLDPKFYDWSTNFYDIKIIYEKYNINTSNYSSGTVYKSLNIIPEKNVKIHDASWDTYSLFITLKKIKEEN